VFEGDHLSFCKFSSFQPFFKLLTVFNQFFNGCPASSAVAAQLCLSQMLSGPPQRRFIKKFSTLSYISRPNGLQNKIS